MLVRNRMMGSMLGVALMVAGCFDGAREPGAEAPQRKSSGAPACWDPGDPTTHYVDLWDSTDPADYQLVGYIKAIQTAQTGAQHYNYFSASAHPSGVALAGDRANLWVHEGTGTGDVTFSFAFGQDNSGVPAASSAIDFRVVDSTTATFVARSDDGGEAVEAPPGSGAYVGDYTYGNNTDGIAVSGLGGAGWTVIVDSVGFGPFIDTWLAASGEDSSFDDDVPLVLGHEYRLTPACNDPSGLPVHVNQPPTASCQDRVVEADAACQACASVDGGSSDPDGDAITVTETPSCSYSQGDTEVTLEVTDAYGASATCTATVSVVDASAPEVAVSPMQLMQFPRTWALEELRLSDCAAVVADNCDAALDIDAMGTIVAIHSDEPSTGGANHDCDAEPALCTDVVIVDASTFQIRNTRDSYGNGRVYTVDFTVSDSAGNTTGVYSCEYGVRLWSTHVPVADPPAYSVYP